MTGSCPDPNVIAGYCDRTLAAAERARWESHFADCARCQQVLAVMARLEDRLPRPLPLPEPVPAWRERWSWTWLAPAAAVLAAGVLWSVIRPTLTPSTLSSPEPSAPAATAEHDSVASKAEARADTPAREAVGDVARQAAPVRPPRAPARAEAAPAPRTQPGRGETAALETTLAKTVAAGQANVVREEPAGIARAGGAAEAVKPAERVAPSDRLATRAQLAEPQAAASHVVLAAAPSPILTIVASPDPTTLWRIGAGGLVERSTDAGRSWQRQDSGVRAALTAGSSPAPGVCWVVGRQGTVIRTVDGSTWDLVTPPVRADLILVTARDDLSATITAADGRQFVTADGGRTWRGL